MSEAMDVVIGLRGTALPGKVYAAWRAKLEDWYPEQVAAAAHRVADEWVNASAWPIGALIAKLPKRKADEQAYSFDGFWWAIDGRCGGDWAIVAKMPEEERLALALNVLAYGQDEAQVKLAHGFHEGALERFLNPPAVKGMLE